MTKLWRGSFGLCCSKQHDKGGEEPSLSCFSVLTRPIPGQRIGWLRRSPPLPLPGLPILKFVANKRLVPNNRSQEASLTATILDGKALAAQIEAELSEQVAEFIHK